MTKLKYMNESELKKESRVQWAFLFSLIVGLIFLAGRTVVVIYLGAFDKIQAAATVGFLALFVALSSFPLINLMLIHYERRFRQIEAKLGIVKS